MAKEKKIKEPIKVRQKPLQNGNISLYLDNQESAFLLFPGRVRCRLRFL